MMTDTYAIERVHPPRRLINFFNPLMAWFIRRSESLGEALLVLHYEGRKTGRKYDVPIGYRQSGNHLVVLSDSGWRHNFAGGRTVEVTLKGIRRPATATLIADPDEVAATLEEAVTKMGPKKAAQRLGVRIGIDRAPSRTEWIKFLQRTGLSIVRIDLA